MPDALALARRYHGVLNDHEAAAAAPMFAEDAVYISPGVGSLVGRSAIIAAFTAYFAEYADQVAEDDEMTALDAYRVRSAWRLTATSARMRERSCRSGTEIITFDDAGLITRIEVEDR